MAKSNAVAAGSDDESIDQSLFPSAADLNEAEGVWNQGHEESKKRNPVGTMQGEILGAALERSASSGRLQVHYTLKVLVGAAAGEELNKYDGLGSPKQTSITQQQLKRVGIDTGKVSLKTLPAALLTLIGKKCMFSGKQNNEFYNITIQRLMTDNPADAKLGGKPLAGTPRAGGTPKKF